MATTLLFISFHTLFLRYLDCMLPLITIKLVSFMCIVSQSYDCAHDKLADRQIRFENMYAPLLGNLWYTKAILSLKFACVQ